MSSVKSLYVDWPRIDEIVARNGDVILGFLDCDGVMNNEGLYSRPEIIQKIKNGTPSDYIFDPNSCRLINQLAKDTDMVIFITSDIRTNIINGKYRLDAMRELIPMNNLTAEIVGVTPPLPSGSYEHPDRGKEIDYVLDYMKVVKIKVGSYVIIDDYDKYIEPHQKEYFVKCDYRKGFQEEEYRLAERILIGG